jgi:hypothetical protein
MPHRKRHTLIHLNDSGCEIDSQSFKTWDDMEQYIDDECLPFWEDGDSLVCDGEVREVFQNYSHAE